MDFTELELITRKLVKVSTEPEQNQLQANLLKLQKGLYRAGAKASKKKRLITSLENRNSLPGEIVTNHDMSKYFEITVCYPRDTTLKRQWLVLFT